MTPKNSSARHRGRLPPGVKGRSSPEYPSGRAYHAASRIHEFSGMWPNELCKGFVPDRWGTLLIESLSALVSLVVANKVDIEEVRRRLKGHANHHPRTKYPQLRKSDILKARKWLRSMGIDTKHTNPNESATVNDQSDDEIGDSDATEADSEPVDEIVALGLPEDHISEDTDEDEDEVEEDEKENEEQHDEPGEIVEIEDETDEETVVDPGGDGFMMNDSPEPVQPNGLSGPDHGTSTPDSASAASSRPRRRIQQPSRLVLDTPRSSVRQSSGSAEYTSATLAVRSPPGSQVPVPVPATSQRDMRPPQQPTPTASPANTMQNFVKPRPQSHTAVPLPPIPGTKNAMQLQRSNSQLSASTSASNSRSSATPRTQASSQPLASPRTSATSQTPQQQLGNWSPASNLVAPQGVYTQLANSQQSTPHHLVASRPSGNEFAESLKNFSDAIKPVAHKFEELLADINDEQLRLFALQSSLVHNKNGYTNYQKRVQDALQDVEKSTANETTRLEEAHQKDPEDAEICSLIKKRKQTIVEHKEVYVIVKSELDKSIAGIYKTDHEIAVITKRLGQLDAERADVLREKEDAAKAAQRVNTMHCIMTLRWQNLVDPLEVLGVL
ncbi:hypothetical protein FOMA001_g19270 [Fusarium oxysporum f. sp. matthiolae]|nr:hypothetical protein FOMA001_g19270 [Fusarium oxysporum f. sp. matthiolae]